MKARAHQHRHEAVASGDGDPASLGAMACRDEGVGIPLSEVVAWVESWDTDGELPEPRARKLF